MWASLRVLRPGMSGRLLAKRGWVLRTVEAKSKALRLLAKRGWVAAPGYEWTSEASSLSLTSTTSVAE